MPPTTDRDHGRSGSTRAARPRVVVGLAGGEGAEGGLLRSLGLEVLAVVSSGPALAEAVEEHTPDLVLLHTHLPDANPDLPRHLRDRYGVLTVLLVPARLHQTGGPETNDAGVFPLLHQAYPMALLSEAERAGCAFVASWPPVPDELRLVVAQVLSRGRTIHSTGERHRAAPGAEQAEGARKSRLIAVWGQKGGAGKSELVVTIACALAFSAGRRVLVVDLDTTNAALHRMLGLSPTREQGYAAYAAAVEASPAGEPPEVAPYVVPYRPAGQGNGRPSLDVLVGTTDLDAREKASRNQRPAGALLRAAQAHYDDVIVDLGTHMSTPVHPRVAASADLVLVAVTPTLAGVEGTAAVLASLSNATQLNRARCRLIVNQVTGTPGGDELRLADIRAYFPGVQVLALLPADPAMTNRPAHTPWILSQDRRTRQSALVRSLEAMVNEITPRTFPPRPQGLIESFRAGIRRRRESRAASARMAGSDAGAPPGLSGRPAGRRGTFDRGNAALTPPLPGVETGGSGPVSPRPRRFPGAPAGEVGPRGSPGAPAGDVGPRGSVGGHHSTGGGRDGRKEFGDNGDGDGDDDRGL